MNILNQKGNIKYMNRGRKIKQMKKFINKYGIIDKWYKRPACKSFPPYRKGSYVAVFLSDKLDLSSSVGDRDKYQVYKRIVKDIKERIQEEK